MTDLESDVAMVPQVSDREVLNWYKAVRKRFVLRLWQVSKEAKVDTGTLSQVIQGKRTASEKVMAKLRKYYERHVLEYPLN